MYANQIKTDTDNEALSSIENEILNARRVGKIRDSYARNESNASNFTLVNQHGNFVTLFDSLENTPVVINFYSTTRNNAAERLELILLNKKLSALNIQHYVVSHDQLFLNQLPQNNKLIHMNLLHDQHFSVFFQYGLVNEEIDTPFELFENRRKPVYPVHQHVNAMYLIGMNKRILFSQLNFSDESIHKQGLLDEIEQLTEFSDINSSHEQH